MQTANSADPSNASRIVNWLLTAPQTWFWLLCVDVYPALIAVSIPWSTTAVIVFTFIWFVVLLPTTDRSLLATFTQPAAFLPILLVVFAIAGTLWAEGPWEARLQGLSPLAKLLVIPFLLYHFQRSQRGHWVLVAFLFSCSVLLVFSWIVFFIPEWRIGRSAVSGVPIKNSIDQSQEFVLCIFILAALLPNLLKQRRLVLCGACVALLLTFFSNMIFVVLARTALVCIPILLMLFAMRYLSLRSTASLFAGTALVGLITWFASPYLRDRVGNIVSEYEIYRDTGAATSTGQRLAYWSYSADAIEKAPLFGHGTGATKQMFDREAAKRTGYWADSIRNPHNQVLYVAVQWGAFGTIILLAMWYFHLSLFVGVGFIGWIGLVVVVQNFVSSLFNSHLFDFTTGWIYVLGVGVAGGMNAGARKIIEPDYIRNAQLRLAPGSE